ncbi:putative conjugative transfer TraI domain protein, partial [Orientia tsutsugamushi str. TA763]
MILRMLKNLYNKSSSLYYFKQEEEAKLEAIVVNKFLNHTEIYSSKIFNNPNLRANMVFDKETQK